MQTAVRTPVRIKIYINGFEWYLDNTKTIPMLYEDETSNDGYSIYTNFFTTDERRQVFDYIKYKL
jgi:hypothetical protein